MRRRCHFGTFRDREHPPTPHAFSYQGETKELQQNSLIVVLAIATEIDAYRGFTNKEAIGRVWGLLVGFVEEAKDVYLQRYEAVLAGSRVC